MTKSVSPSKRSYSIVLALSGVLFISSPLLGQGSLDCPTEVLAKTEGQVGHLGQEEWTAFFGVLEPRCKDDIRFMGWVNDLLYRTLEAQPSEFINAFDTLPKITQRLILDQFTSPGHAGLDPVRTYDRIRDAAGSAESKQRILQALTKAGCRCDTELVQ